MIVGSDTVALEVLPNAGGEGAARFSGWLAPLTDVAADPQNPTGFRFFTDPQFMEWLEIAAGDILSKTDGDADLEGRSYIWVKREAIIKRCQSGRAYQFSELEEAKAANDPTAAIRPRGYP